MWHRPANNIPQLTRKGSQPHGFVSGTYFFGSRNLWVSRVEVFTALYGAFGKKLHWDRYVFILLFDTPFPGLKQHYNVYGAIIIPIGF